jgi:hypothetical protein
MTELDPSAASLPQGGPSSAAAPTAAAARRLGWLPSWGLIATKHLELRKRRGLMVAVALLTAGIPVLVLGIRLAFHALDPASFAPAGSPSGFTTLTNVMAEFGFIVAAALGTTAGSTDLSDGVFRHLVITGRSRLALYLARIPAGLAILVPLVAVGFTALCLVTSYAGIPQPTSVGVNGIAIPAHLDQAQLRSWAEQHPQGAASVIEAKVDRGIATFYRDYRGFEVADSNPAASEMAKVGLWLELEIIIGFVVGLGLGSLTGQRTVSTILLIALEIIVTPILALHVIPYFLDGQRLVVGVAMDQLRPAALASGAGPVAGPGGNLLRGGGSLQIPPMPTWAMIAVIVGWIVGWSVLGAWRMMSRDA